jgi:hypothetical protein
MPAAFRAKTWIYRAEFILFTLLAAFALSFGPLFWTGRLRDIHDQPRPETGLILVIVGIACGGAAALAGFNVAARRKPLLVCYREGVQAHLIGITSLDNVPFVPLVVRGAFAIVSLQGFRVQLGRIPWEVFERAEVSGFPMHYVLTLYGRVINPAAGQIITNLSFAQVDLIDPPHVLADAINAIAADPTRRDRLPSWPA